ncbi:hypothetical protein HUG10_05620 [Halorarum halophilum]|uniref:Uncharacterized protein n=1 Tax=Halorarum halophilum TaxID=2743090 RepID=A0A7D5GYT9_9EURY|nr:hypothetical protein [Halobaculum halophilum]QLG27053.1 hypothetical protein HUG10_05620 [Halobaculum halophilum]
MTHGRRTLLRGFGSGLPVLFGGCLASRSSVRYPPTDAADASGATVDDAGYDGGPDEGLRAGAEPEPSNPVLAERTRRVDDELRWFAEAYPDAIVRFRAAIQRSVRATRALRDADDVGEGDVDDLGATYATTFADAREALDGHFRVVAGIERRVEYHLSVVRKFARRDDRDRTDEELGRLASFAGGFGTSLYAEQSLSRNPVQNHLVRFLRNGGFDEERTLLWQLARDPAEGTRFETYAYEGQRSQLFRPPVTGEDSARVDDWYGPLEEPTDRTAAATLAFHRVDRSDGSTFPTRRPEVAPIRTVRLQRYADARTAADALSRVDSRVVREGSYDLGDTTWRRVYYRRAGDVTYALCCRAGEFILATGAGETAWEERVDWDRTHLRMWLAGD